MCVVGREGGLLTDIAIAEPRKVQLQGGPGEAGLGHNLLEVLPAGLAIATDTTSER